MDPTDERDVQAEHRAFLEAPPPSDQVEAVAGRLGLGTPRAVTRLEGGLETAVHRIDFDRTSIVLRRFNLARGWHDAGRIEHEAAVLDHLAVTAVPAPEVLLADPTGTVVGCPALVLTLLEGRTMAPARVDRDTLHRLARAIQAVHQVAPGSLPRTVWREAWQGDPPAAPTSARIERVWEAILVSRDELAGELTVLAHHDLHPGNTLWRDGVLTGVVDWGAAGAGFGSFDVAYCAKDLGLSLGPDANAAFLDAWQDVTGAPLHPGWRAVALWSLVDDLEALPPAYAELGMPTTPTELASRFDRLLDEVRAELGLAS